MRRGALIVLEGCDRVGKSTQAKKLVEELNKHSIRTERFSFPDRSTLIGQVIHNYLIKNTELTDKAIHLLFTANRWELEPKISELLIKGTTLIIDRYSYSGIAYSSAKHVSNKKSTFFYIYDRPRERDAKKSKVNFSEERFKNIDDKWCWQVESGLPKPDLVFFLQMSSKTASSRNNYGNERYENQTFQEKVFFNFQKMKDSSWKDVNANGSIDAVNKEILKYAKEVISRVSHEPLSRFS